MKEIKVVFMGTPSFAVPILEYLIKEYTIKNGEAVETKTYYSEEMP